jgi:hypothetical protein
MDFHRERPEGSQSLSTANQEQVNHEKPSQEPPIHIGNTSAVIWEQARDRAEKDTQERRLQPHLVRCSVSHHPTCSKPCGGAAILHAPSPVEEQRARTQFKRRWQAEAGDDGRRGKERCVTVTVVMESRRIAVA